MRALQGTRCRAIRDEAALRFHTKEGALGVVAGGRRLPSSARRSRRMHRPDALGRYLGKEQFDEIQPGRARRCEVQLEARMLGEPRPSPRPSVRPLVVEHDPDRGAWPRTFAPGFIRFLEQRPRRIDDEAALEHRASRTARSSTGPAACDQAPGLDSSRRHTHQRPVRRVQVETDDIGRPSPRTAVVRHLEFRDEVRLTPASARMRCTLV